MGYIDVHNSKLILFTNVLVKSNWKLKFKKNDTFASKHEMLRNSLNKVCVRLAH